MKNKLDKILPAILWLTVVMLVACFWFRAWYGFDLFSRTHWDQLARMQAAQMPVKTGFYISIIVFVAATILGLYRIVRPRLRRIRFERPENTTKNTEKDRQMPANAAPEQNASVVQIMPGNTGTPAAPAPLPDTPVGTAQFRRPPRLNIPANAGQFRTSPTGTAPATQSPVVTPQTQPFDTDAVRKIFESAGYVSKGTPRIKGMPTALFAIGTDEVLWIGAANVATTAMRTAINTLQDVFTDTLDDIEININAFIINATDAATTDDAEILQFESTDALGEYMAGHPNAPLSPDDRAGFDAYSAYISTVADYIAKV